MAEGIMIFGAIGTAIGLLNLARQGFDSLVKTYREFRDAGQTINEIQRQFDDTLHLIRSWENVWIKNQTTEEEFKVFWGKAGWRRIRPRLDAIRTKCEDLATLLKPFITADHSPPISDNMWEKVRGRVENRAPRRVTKALTLGKKAKFVLRSSDRLRNYLDRLQVDYDVLLRLVDSAWGEKHPTVPWSILTFQQRRLIALEKTRKPILRAAKRDRTEIIHLHPFCIPDTGALDLELNLLRTAAGIPQMRSFHMIIPQGWTHLQVCAEVTQEVHQLVETTFSDACRIVQDGFQCVFRAGVTIPAHQHQSSEPIPSLFSLNESSTPMYMPQYSIISLSRKLNYMQIAERLDLAYKVVECGLLLLDTPWLSTLGSNTITRFRRSGNRPKYFLGIHGHIADCVSQRLPDGIGQLNVHIFAIGVLLVELALCTVVLDVEMYEYTVSLVKKESRKRRLSSRQREVRQVRKQWGDLYAEAVEFCLQDPSRAPNHTLNEIMDDPTASAEEISNALLGEFYKNVFLKIALVHSRINIRRTQEAW